MELAQSPAIAPPDKVATMRTASSLRQPIYVEPFDETNPKFQNGKDNADHSSASFQTRMTDASADRAR
jgi:hypothetical protein